MGDLSIENMTLFAAYGTLLLAGLAGSLHCIGMCGPILLGFASVFERAQLSIEGAPVESGINKGGDGPVHSKRPSLVMDFACYHAGRIWTYGVLGFVAGLIGRGLRDSAFFFGFQRPLALAISIAVVLSGLVLLDIIPGVKADTLFSGCGIGKFKALGWFTRLTQTRGWVSRLLLGAVMGFLPCGLIYAMLVLVTAFQDPLYSALGMIAFGIGTLPSLSGVLIASRLVPARLRTHGTRLAAVLLIAMGTYMTVRTIIVVPDSESCPFCAAAEMGGGDEAGE
jgi:sulfite exporter TauE/SafE